MVVFGTGGIGLNAIMAAALVGGNPVIGMDINASRRDLALAFGATHVIDPAAGGACARKSTQSRQRALMSPSKRQEIPL